jgi:hypothetical protein
MEELMQNLHQAIEACLTVDVARTKPGSTERVVEVVL